jgi:hypothetical protein
MITAPGFFSHHENGGGPWVVGRPRRDTGRAVSWLQRLLSSRVRAAGTPTAGGMLRQTFAHPGTRNTGINDFFTLS